MWPNESRTIPDWIEDAYTVLVSQTADRKTGFSHEQAQELLLAHDTFADDPADTQYAIEYLLNYGWLYEANDELRVTSSPR